jgi:hypothetical protein
MKASGFEYRNQRWIHLSLVAAAFGVYAFDPVNLVWALVQHQPDAHALERALFAVATVFAGSGAVLRTLANRFTVRSSGSSLRRHLGSVLFALGIGSLAPLWGFVTLAAGEAVLATRLLLYERNLTCAHRPGVPAPSWASAVRTEAAKWGLFVTMTVFTAVLIDRVADILAVASLLTAAALNWRSYCRPSG